MLFLLLFTAFGGHVCFPVDDPVDNFTSEELRFSGVA